MSAVDCAYRPLVDPEDVLEVDFDCAHVATDGLYLIEVVFNEEWQWGGCRRFARTPGGVRMDGSGGGDWAPAPEGLRIVGRVRQVFEAKRGRGSKT